MLIKAERLNKQFGFILRCISVLWKWIISKYANNRSMIHTLLPSWLGCVIYLNSMYGDMVHDDIPAILKNPDVNGKNPWHKSFFNDFWGNAMSDITSHKSYRPITTLLFRFNFYVCGGGNGNSHTWCFHGTNVLLHGCATTLLSYICRQRLKMKTESTFITSLIFALHPIHTEAVSGLVGCADLLACNFTLTSFLAYTRYLKTPSLIRWRIISVMSAVLAVLSKETGIMAMVINISVAVVNYLIENVSGASIYNKLSKNDFEKVGQNPITSKLRRRKQTLALKRIFTDVIMLGILASMRLMIQKSSMPHFSAQDNPAAFHPEFSTRILTFLYLPVYNFWLLLCPEKLSYDWQMGSLPLIHFSDITNDLTFIAIPLFYGAILWFIFVLLKRLQSQGSQITCKKEDNRMMIGVGNVFFKFINRFDFFTSFSSTRNRKIDEGSMALPTNSGQSVSNNGNTKVPSFSNSSNENFPQYVALLFLILPFLPASNLFFPVGFVIAERILYLPSIGFCILVGLGFERIMGYSTLLKLRPNVEKEISNGCDTVNNNGCTHEVCQNVFKNEPNATCSASKFSYEVTDKDINHNDILASSTTKTLLSKPTPTTTSSSSCSWWMLFLVNPRRRQKPQHNDSDILSKEAISHITFHCNHTNVSSNMKHPSILKARHVTAAISVSNYQLSVPTRTTISSHPTNLNVLEETSSAKIKNFDTFKYLHEKFARSKSDKSKYVFTTHLSCVEIPRKKHFMRISKKKNNLKLLFNLLFMCICVVFFAFALKTWTRNQDWNSRKSLFRSGVKTQPNNAKAHYNFANVLREEKNVEQAIKHYKIALKLWPSYVLAHNNLATLLEDKHKAEYHLRTALSIDPWHPNSLYNLAVFMSERGLYEEAILLLEKCITEDYSHERAHTLLSQCLLKKYKSGNKINEDNESRMGKCQKEVKDKKGKYDTRRFRTENRTNAKNVGGGIKRKARNRKAKVNLILSFATKVSGNKDKKKLDDVISSYFKSFHFLRRNIMGQTKKNNDENNNNNNNNDNNNQEKKGKGKNDINCYDEHDINVTSTTTLTHKNNHNHKTHLKKLDYYTIKEVHVVEFNENENYKTEKERTLLTRYQQDNMIKDTKSREISLHRKFYTNLSKLFPNQLIQINHLKKKTTNEKENDDGISVQNKEKTTNKSSMVKGEQAFDNDILPSIYQGKELHVDVNSLLMVEKSKMLQSAKENDANGRADAGHVLQQLQCTN